MKRILLASAGIFLLGVASCSSGASTVTPGSGGTNGGTAGTNGGTAGTTGSAGTDGTAGTTGSGGTSAGTAGTDGTAGTTGTAGSTAGTAGSGGAVGSGGAAGTGTAGSGAAGTGAGGRGGSGTAGTTGTGGRGGSGTAGTTGTGGRGGSGTAGTTGTGGTGGDLLSIVNNWDGALVQFPCNDKRTGYDCGNIGCSGGTATNTTTWMIGGTTGTIYNVTVRIRGIVEVQAYGYPGSGVRDAGNASITTTAGKDLFQRGGTVMASGGVSYDYNNYELTVTPAVPTSVSMYSTYYLNSVIMSENPHASSNVTAHLTFDIDYTKTIPVTGGGMVRLRVFDSNCALVQNCGPTSGNTCVAPRTVSLAGAVPAPTNFVQPFQGNVTGAYGQWVHFDVTGVTVAP